MGCEIRQWHTYLHVEVVLDIGKVFITDVVLVPELGVDSDVLSVPSFMMRGFAVAFEGNKAIISRDGKALRFKMGMGRGMSLLEEFHGVANFALSMKCTDIQQIEMQYKRPGHIGTRIIRSMVESIIDRTGEYKDRGTQH